MARAGFRVIKDGIVEWYNGPEWDELAVEEFQKAESQVETVGRQNAPWADRTGNARAGLTAEAYGRDHSAVLEFFHTVDYGKWLELIQNGRFAIIMPTLETEGRRIMYNAIRRIRYARKGSA
jgi:hypothetical protein